MGIQKNKFQKKMSDIKGDLTFEEMAASNNSANVFKDPTKEVEFEDEPQEREFEEVPDERTFEEENAGRIISKEDLYNAADYIPKAQLDEYIKRHAEQLIGERLDSMSAVATAPPPKQQPVPRKVETADDLPEFANWETKDRIYVLATGFSPLSQGIKDRHKKNSPLMYKGRSLRFSTSQASFFMDQQTGDVLTTYLSIENGRLFVPKENSHLQKFLAIHPDNGVVFKEFDPKQQSRAAYDEQKLKVDAHILSRSLDTPTLVAVAMLMCKDYNETLDLFTVKRDLYNEIEANPKLFIKLAGDRSLKLKSTGKIAVFRGFLRYADYRFYDENDVVVCEVGRNENEYDALASYFSSSEGRSLYEYLAQKIGS